jgi:protein-tyrosine kinase
MSIINQASKRLEQLRQAGVELPWADTNPASDATLPASAAASTAPPPTALAEPQRSRVAPSPAPVAKPTPLAKPAAAPFSASVPLSIRAVPSETPLNASEGVFLSSIVTPAQHTRDSAAKPLPSPVPEAPVAAPLSQPQPMLVLPEAPRPLAPQPVVEPTATPQAPAAINSHSDVARPSVRSPDVTSAPAVSQTSAKHSATIQLDLHALAMRKLLVPSCDDRGLINEFRALKRPLVNNALGKNAPNVRRGNVIVVTSAMPGEGKTYCAINLALSMAAQVDNTVLLIDADVVKPALSQRLGLPPTLGLLDLLSEDARPMHEVLLRTNVPKLSIIPSSAPRPDSAERVSSDRMEALVEELSTRYPDRIIVIDAPPLLLTNESRILANLAGQVVMVVEAGKTTMRAAADAFQAVESCPVVMSVLNKRSQALRGYGYGYGYGDGY